MILFYFFIISLFAQSSKPCLCIKNEVNVFSFATKNQKITSVCTGKNDAYLLYRYGTKQKIELQYPNSLDSSSWQKFNFDFYFRGRGKSNAGMEENYLSFVNKGIQYTIFHNYTAKDDNMLLGISIVLPIKTQEIKGILKSRRGMMSTLQNKVPTSDD